MDLDKYIKKVPDFPKKGILFYDITGVLINPPAFKYVNEKLCELYKDTPLDGVAAIESRGFVFASYLAIKRNIPIFLVRKKGKLPRKTISRSYELEYGSATLEIHSEDIQKGMKILIIDDLIATGGTIKATCDMIEELGAKVVGIFAIIGLPFLKYEILLNGYKIQTLINYQSE